MRCINIASAAGANLFAFEKRHAIWHAPYIAAEAAPGPGCEQSPPWADFDGAAKTSISYLLQF